MMKSQLTDRWLRSEDGILAGICSGLGRSFGMDPWLIRALWLIAILVFGTGILAYILLWIALPSETDAHRGQERRLLGVCARLSRQFDIEVGLVRLACLTAGIFSGGVTLVAYVVLYFVYQAQTPQLPQG